MTLSADEALATTRAVRRRLDLDRPVARGLVDDCLRLAVQAPTSEGNETWHFVVVEDAATRTEIGRIYRDIWMSYTGVAPEDDRPGEAPRERSSRYLATVIGRAPVHVLFCVEGRPEGAGVGDLAALYGSIIQAGWSFQIAARARGLGTVWTTYHLDREREVADLVGIPYERVTQVGLVPVAHVLGDRPLRPARRRPLDEVLHRDQW